MHGMLAQRMHCAFGPHVTVNKRILRRRSSTSELSVSHVNNTIIFFYFLPGSVSLRSWINCPVNCESLTKRGKKESKNNRMGSKSRLQGNKVVIALKRLVRTGPDTKEKKSISSYSSYTYLIIFPKNQHQIILIMFFCPFWS